MDLRVEKTKNSIIHAFIELRKKKPLEKITVKELSDMARINKATFYRHYSDIYALSESIEIGLIQKCVDMIDDPDKLFDKEGIRLFTEALAAQGDIYKIIFSGSRKDAAINRLHDCLIEKMLLQHPEYEHDIEKKVMFTTLAYGASRAYLIYDDVDKEVLINSLAKLNRAMQ